MRAAISLDSSALIHQLLFGGTWQKSQRLSCCESFCYNNAWEKHLNVDVEKTPSKHVVQLAQSLVEQALKAITSALKTR
ncbi:hypothetical protein PQR62_12590 [Herbaspirillum lusitanum]|uniref:Uncharacterized protein n=1 Tax=Herbaspirillum lusitanum TaxID=213312 RepID=A0ABW9A876_9BURK